MSWIENSVNNLLPLSVEYNNFKIALSEWLYTGEMYDNEYPTETCELCEHPDIRYEFKIVNQYNGNELFIGSECICKFAISAIDDDGYILDSEKSIRRVHRDKNKLVKNAQRKRLINSLIELSRVDKELDINSFINYVQDRGAFTPNQLSTLIWRFNKFNIQYQHNDLKMTIRRNREKHQLVVMEDWKINKLWPSMSKTQRNWVLINTSYTT